MSAHRIQTFDEFWPYYVGEHRSPVGRGLHYFGTLSALGCLVASLALGSAVVLAAVPLAGYGPAWIAHFFIERNRPATFKYPLFSLRGDFKMLGLALRGKMASEVTRLYGSAAPPPDAPLLAQ